MRVVLRLCFMLLGFAALAGCALLYTSHAPENVTLQAKGESDGVFPVKGTRLGIYRLGDTCPAEFLGWVDVEEKPVHFGLPPGQKFYLRFSIPNSGSGKERKNRNGGVILTARKDAQYLVKVNRVGGQFAAKVQEVDESGKVLRDFAHSSFPCPAH